MTTASVCVLMVKKVSSALNRPISHVYGWSGVIGASPFLLIHLHHFHQLHFVSNMHFVCVIHNDYNIFLSGGESFLVMISCVFSIFKCRHRRARGIIKCCESSPLAQSGERKLRRAGETSDEVSRDSAVLLDINVKGAVCSFREGIVIRRERCC